MTVPCAAAMLALALAAAEARVDLRFAEARLSITPPAVEVGGESTVSAVLALRPGYEWHSPRLAPLRVEVKPVAGWRVEPAMFDLPPPANPREPRGFTVRVTRVADEPGPRVALINLRYGVRRSGPEGEIAFEEAALEIDLPVLDRAAELPAEVEVGASILVETGGEGPPSAADQGSPRQGSPVLPAVALAISTGLLLGGIWLALARGRVRGEDA